MCGAEVRAWWCLKAQKEASGLEEVHSGGKWADVQEEVPWGPGARVGSRVY